MNISGSGIVFDVGLQDDFFNLSLDYAPSEIGTGVFSMSLYDESNVNNLRLFFSSGRILKSSALDARQLFLDTYVAGNNNISLNFSSDKGYDIFTNGQYCLSERASGLDVTKVGINSSGVNVFYNLDMSGITPDFPVTDLYFTTFSGEATGFITNNTSYPLLINSISNPSGEITVIDSTVSASNSGEFIFQPNGQPNNGSFYTLSFDTNYGVFNKTLEVNNPYDVDLSYYFTSIKGDNSIVANNGSGQSLFTISINTNAAIEPLYISLDYVSGSGAVYGNYPGTGIGTGLFQGSIKGSGKLHSPSITGYLSATNNSGDTLYALGSGSSTSINSYYPTGLIQIPYSVPAYHFFTQQYSGSGDILSIQGDVSYLMGPASGYVYTTSGGVIVYAEEGGFVSISYGPTGLIQESGTMYGRIAGTYDFTALDLNSGIYPKIFISGVPEYYYNNSQLEENVSGLSFSGILPRAGLNIQTFNSRITSGVFNGMANIYEGQQSFFTAWNLRIGKDTPFETENYKQLGKYILSPPSYEDTTGVQQLSSGENTYYVYVDYFNNFSGSHIDVSKLNVQYKDISESYLITGSN